MTNMGTEDNRRVARAHHGYAPKPGATIVMRKRSDFRYDVFRRGPGKEGERLVCVLIAAVMCGGKARRWHAYYEGQKTQPTAVVFTLKSFRAWAKTKYHCI